MIETSEVLNNGRQSGNVKRASLADPQLKDVRANCFCASLLRTLFIAQCQATSCIEREEKNFLSTYRACSRCINVACNSLS